MANVSVLKNDGTTSVLYTAVVPSAGDKSAAVWRNLTVGTAAAHRPEAKMVSLNNGPASARRVRVEFRYPTLVTDTTGKTQVADSLRFEGSWLVPQGMPDTDVNEGVSQLANLLAAALFKDSVKSGYAPT
jgi:hypothetical protein